MPTIIPFLKRMLVVDDEYDIVRLLKRGLENSGFPVDAFTNPQEALNYFKRDTYELVILDIRMPMMNGFELYRKLAKIDSKIKVCFMTAFEIHYNEVRMMFPEINPSALIKKPMLPSQLVKVVNQCIEKK